MVTQEAKIRNDRFITMNVNIDMENVAGMLQGSKEPVY